MDLRNLPPDLTPEDRVAERRRRIQEELGVNLSLLATEPERIGSAEEKNCEQMFGTVPLPVGYAGPLSVTFSDGTKSDIHLPLATTEGALVASVNRGCKALASGVTVQSTYHGISRSIAFGAISDKRSAKSEIKDSKLKAFICEHEKDWKRIGEETSSHLKILSYDIDQSGEYVFLTINADTDEAMGMNMVTIAAQAIGDVIEKECNCELVTIAANVDSDKKPSVRTHDRGRGYTVTAAAVIPSSLITDVLKTTPEKLLSVADAKLMHGSKLAGAIGNNLHAANIIAALYLATGQDAAHVVEGSLCDTTFERITNNESRITVRSPAILVGTRGGGTSLPAQSQCLNLLLPPTPYALPPTPHPRPTQRLAESIGAAVLAGELSLLAAQAGHDLARAHKRMAR
ncbi:3-hydroxy-3-methylglutaryl-CoA reductase [Candidatus Peregrinibacteria bacterium]|nr:3-hydroxy-3-methylglutaryl-CoA reductase [Candidatus Peregrinibacteria bacterium]